jgi:hypothetical protein
MMAMFWITISFARSIMDGSSASHRFCTLMSTAQIELSRCPIERSALVLLITSETARLAHLKDFSSARGIQSATTHQSCRRSLTTAIVMLHPTLFASRWMRISDVASKIIKPLMIKHGFLEQLELLSSLESPFKLTRRDIARSTSKTISWIETTEQSLQLFGKMTLSTRSATAWERSMTLGT